VLDRILARRPDAEICTSSHYILGGEGGTSSQEMSEWFDWLLSATVGTADVSVICIVGEPTAQRTRRGHLYTVQVGERRPEQFCPFLRDTERGKEFRDFSVPNVTYDDLGTLWAEDIVQLVDAQYVMRSRGAVHQFLADHRGLEEALIHLPALATKWFGSDIRLELDVIKDPEFPEWVQLFVFICTSSEVDEALQALHFLEDEWFRRHPPALDDLLTFTLDVL